VTGHVGRGRRCLGTVAALALVLAGTAQAQAKRTVPFGFFGVHTGATYYSISPKARAKEPDVMVKSGVETVRLLFNWAGAQPYKTFADVPASRRRQFVDIGGVPTDFSKIDADVAPDAARGLAILPVVSYAPTWARSVRQQPGAEPSDNAAYGRFLTALIQRYGPRGTFWRTHPVPATTRIRRWHVWNEPDLPYMWSNDARDFAPGYIELLRAAHAAVKAADPGGQVVLGGLTSSVTWPQVWNALDAVYAAGGRGLFDVVAVHPYTREPANVLKILQLVRGVMAKNGDAGTSLLVSEMGWSSREGHGGGLAPWEVTAAQQAKNLTSAFTQLVAHRAELKLVGLTWYTWISNDRSQNWSFWSGLRRAGAPGQVIAKPALAAFTQATRRFEGCSKAALATRCAR
jgi:hypothetical protein